MATGALGYLIYSFVTYAFLIALNAATILYIAVLGFGADSAATKGRISTTSTAQGASQRD